MNKKEFQLSVSETIEQYQVPSIDQGLDEAQVTERLETYGLNQLAVKKNRQVAFAAAAIP